MVLVNHGKPYKLKCQQGNICEESQISGDVSILHQNHRLKQLQLCKEDTQKATFGTCDSPAVPSIVFTMIQVGISYPSPPIKAIDHLKLAYS